MIYPGAWEGRKNRGNSEARHVGGVGGRAAEIARRFASVWWLKTREEGLTDRGIQRRQKAALPPEANLDKYLPS